MHIHFVAQPSMYIYIYIGGLADKRCLHVPNGLLISQNLSRKCSASARIRTTCCSDRCKLAKDTLFIVKCKKARSFYIKFQ